MGRPTARARGEGGLPEPRGQRFAPSRDPSAATQDAHFLDARQANEGRHRPSERYLETHTDEYRLLLRKGETDASPACDLVGCLPEGLFAPNEAGWAIYQRSDY